VVVTRDLLGLHLLLLFLASSSLEVQCFWVLCLGGFFLGVCPGATGEWSVVLGCPGATSAPLGVQACCGSCFRFPACFLRDFCVAGAYILGSGIHGGCG
jgi:hypothetical protein